MNISTLFEQKKAVISFEVFPPKKNMPVEVIYESLQRLAALSPDFISVTYGAGGTGEHLENRTCELAATIKNKYKIEPLAHLTCVNASKSDIAKILDDLVANGIENVLALRGDKPEKNAVSGAGEFSYADELISFIKSNYNINTVAACYPEGHPENADIETDISYLKIKAEKGTGHFISQLFFDNNDFYSFMYRLRDSGIQLPVQAGIMPVVNKKSIERIVTLCGASLPKKFVKMLSKYENNTEALFDAGIAYATEQIIDLLSNSVSGIHLYTMNNPIIAEKIMGNIGNIVKHINIDRK